MNDLAKLTILSLAFAIALSACVPPPAQIPELTPITLQLAWTHQAQFVGFYAADQNGYYAAEGLKVAFLQGGPNVDLLMPVLNGAAQFGITSPDALIVARADNKPLRAVTTVFRRSPGVFMALESSGIKRPQDFVGKKVQLSPRGVPRLRAIMARVGMRPDQYSIVDSTPDLTPFYSRQVGVRSVFLTNEVLTAQARGYKLNIIFPDDYGVHFYDDAIFTTDEMISKNPDLVKRFTRATLKGWIYVIENPTTAGQLVTKYNATADVAHENASMTASLPLINTGEDFIGWMDPEIWNGMQMTLREQDVLTRTLDVTQVYTLQFIREIYGR